MAKPNSAMKTRATTCTGYVPHHGHMMFANPFTNRRIATAVRNPSRGTTHWLELFVCAIGSFIASYPNSRGFGGPVL